MNADGSEQTKLISDPPVDFSPARSPDGKRIAFVSWRDGNGEVYAIDADSSGLTNLTNNPARDEFPSWSLDGTRVTEVPTTQ